MICQNNSPTACLGTSKYVAHVFFEVHLCPESAFVFATFVAQPILSWSISNTSSGTLSAPKALQHSARESKAGSGLHAACLKKCSLLSGLLSLDFAFLGTRWGFELYPPKVEHFLQRGRCSDQGMYMVDFGRRNLIALWLRDGVT